MTRTNLAPTTSSSPRSVPQTQLERLPSDASSELKRLQAIADEQFGGSLPPAAARYVDPAAVDADGLAAAVQHIDAACQGTTPEAVGQLLGWLSDRVAWPSHLAGDLDAVERNMTMLSEDLAELPYEAIARAVRAYPKRCRWWPSALAELYEPAEREAQAMRGEAANARTLLTAVRRGPDTRLVGNTTYHDPAAAERRRQQRTADRGDRQAQAQRLGDVVRTLRQDDTEEASG